MKRPLCVVCLALVVCTALRIWLYPPVSVSFGEADGREVTLLGRVYAKEFQRGESSPVLLLYVEPSALIFQNKEIPFDDNFICRLQEGGKEPSIGSSVCISGILTEFEPASNPGQFDRSRYYATLGVSAQINKAVVELEKPPTFDLREWLWQLRKNAGKGFDALFLPEDAAILKAMLLGDKSGLTADMKKLYQDSGIMHILAISGLHISILGMGLYRIFYRLHLPVKWATVLCGVAMILYGIMVGMPVSAVRAIIMFLMRQVSECCGRTYDMLTALAVSAMLLLLQEPLYLLNAGFLLSFLAVTAIVVLKPRLSPILQNRNGVVRNKTWKEEKLPRAVDNLITSLAVLVFTLPVQLCFYFEVSVYAPLFNLLVLPLVSALLSAGLGAVSALWLVPFIPLFTRILVAFVHWILNAYEQGGRVVRSLSGAILTSGVPDAWQTVWYAGMLGIIIFLKELQWKFRVGLLCGAVLILTMETHQGLSITMMDVGQGQCICMRLPDGSAWLYDGGSTDVNQVGTYRIEACLKSQGIHTLEAVFLSHEDSDHISGVVEMLQSKEIEIKRLVLPYMDVVGENFAEVLWLAEQRNIPVLQVSKGMQWEHEGVKVQCLHPSSGAVSPEENENSMVLYLTYGDFSMLLTGDTEKNGEEQLLQVLKEKEIKDISVLQVAHHGSRNASSAAFLEHAAPRIALISCSENNRYGHPHEEVLKRLENVGSKVYITSENGATIIEVRDKVSIFPTY